MTLVVQKTPVSPFSPFIEIDEPLSPFSPRIPYSVCDTINYEI